MEDISVKNILTIAQLAEVLFDDATNKTIVNVQNRFARSRVKGGKLVPPVLTVVKPFPYGSFEGPMFILCDDNLANLFTTWPDGKQKLKTFRKKFSFVK